MAITTKRRQDLKSYFVKNAIPTEGNFAELIDAPLNQADDGVFKLAGEPLSVVAAPGDQRRTLRFYTDYPAANPDWLISLKPAQDPANAATTRAGFGIADGAGNTRLFIDSSTGSLGVGTNNPIDALHVANGDVRIAGGEYRRLKIVSDSYWAGIELVARNQGKAGRPHIDFTHGDLDNPNYGIRMSASSNTELNIETLTGDATLKVKGSVSATGEVVATAGVQVAGSRAAHLDVDGAFYRYDGQAYLTVDDNLYIRDTRNGVRVHFDTKNAAVNVTGAVVATGVVSAGKVAIGAASTSYALEVVVPGAHSSWNRFIVSAEGNWGDGNKHVHIGANTGGIMFFNPHVSWQDSRASIRYGRTGGAAGKTWWDAGVRSDGSFSFNASDDGGIGEVMKIAKGGAATFAGRSPLWFRKYTVPRGRTGLDTGVDPKQWPGACVIGLDAGRGDLDEDGNGDNLLHFFLVRLNGRWWVRVNLRTHSSTDANWTVWVMFVNSAVAAVDSGAW